MSLSHPLLLIPLLTLWVLFRITCSKAFARHRCHCWVSRSLGDLPILGVRMGFSRFSLAGWNICQLECFLLYISGSAQDFLETTFQPYNVLTFQRGGWHPSTFKKWGHPCCPSGEGFAELASRFKYSPTNNFLGVLHRFRLGSVSDLCRGFNRRSEWRQTQISRPIKLSVKNYRLNQLQ